MKWVRKYIGSYFVELNGDLDALVFTAGVGEGDELFRSLVTEGLLSLGIDVDPPTKVAACDGEGVQLVPYDGDGGADAGGVVDR